MTGVAAVRVAEHSAGRFVHAVLPAHEADTFTSESAPFAVGVTFTGHADAWVRHDDEQARMLDLRPGTVGVNGARPLAWLRTREPSESVEIVPSPAALARAAAEHGISWETHESYRTTGRDPVIWAASARARRALLTDGVTAEATEELVTVLLAHLATARRGGAGRGGVRREPPGVLGHARTRAVTDRVHGAPFDRHTLGDLAAAVHLSPYHFLRAFTRTVGVTPHRYVAAVRAERLRRLLARDGATVASVAELAGIDPRQVRRLHRQGLGVSPRGR
ncbi:helix-turn-helix transcriptional regulator [Promicromonospora panici]|uniref:helix-turn-helix transcriptional regulator n=1 Tax=Promicromonospora panici TaxID=2219658 RepID=UPI001A92B057|nr:AraC family transcriptional regulator [Promicromonospora panici]